jgi:hypothetical protein
MPIDMSKMKQKLNELKSKGGGTTWGPTEGKPEDVRILPTPDGDPFKGLHFHYNIAKYGVLCPKRNFGDECAACEFAHKLFQEADSLGKDTPEGKATLQSAKDLAARQRFYSPIIVRGEEAEGVRIWGYSKSVYEDLLMLVMNADYGDITDVDGGTDLTLKSAKENGSRYPFTRITPHRRTSPLWDERKMEGTLKDLLDSVPDINSKFERVTSEEIARLLDEKMNPTPSDEELNADEGKSKYDNAEDQSEVDRAFNELTS